MLANFITFTANHLSPNNSFQPSMESILKLYVGLGLDKIPPTVIHLNYNGNKDRIFESYLIQISKCNVFESYLNQKWQCISSSSSSINQPTSMF